VGESLLANYDTCYVAVWAGLTVTLPSLASAPGAVPSSVLQRKLTVTVVNDSKGPVFVRPQSGDRIIWETVHPNLITLAPMSFATFLVLGGLGGTAAGGLAWGLLGSGQGVSYE
jgi:hypothetical protein